MSRMGKAWLNRAGSAFDVVYRSAVQKCARENIRRSGSVLAFQSGGQNHAKAEAITPVDLLGPGLLMHGAHKPRWTGR